MQNDNHLVITVSRDHISFRLSGLGLSGSDPRSVYTDLEERLDYHVNQRNLPFRTVEYIAEDDLSEEDICIIDCFA